VLLKIHVLLYTNKDYECIYIRETRLSSVYQPQRCLRSSSQELLTVPHCKTMLGKRRFSVAAPSVWNSLPLNLRTDYNSLRGFKTNLKTVLFHQDYLASVTQRLRLQLYDLNFGAIQINYLLTYLLIAWSDEWCHLCANSG